MKLTKTTYIIMGSVGAAAVVGTAIAVPVALLTRKSSTTPNLDILIAPKPILKSEFSDENEYLKLLLDRSNWFIFDKADANATVFSVNDPKITINKNVAKVAVSVVAIEKGNPKIIQVNAFGVPYKIKTLSSSVPIANGQPTPSSNSSQSPTQTTSGTTTPSTTTVNQPSTTPPTNQVSTPPTNQPSTQTQHQSTSTNQESWDKIVQSYPKGQIGVQYAHDDIANFGGILYRVKAVNFSGAIFAIAGGSNAAWYPPMDPNNPHADPLANPTNGVDIQAWVAVPENSVGMYVRPSVGGTISAKTIDSSHASASTDTVPTYDPTNQPIIDPLHSTNPNVDTSKITQVQQQLQQVSHALSHTKVIAAPKGAATAIVLPGALEFSGSNGSAVLQPLDLDASITSKYTLKLYKCDFGNSVALNELGDITTLGSKILSLKNGDDVALLVYDKSNNAIVQGAKYNVSTLNVDASAVPMLNDLGLTKGLMDGSVTMENIFKFMDSLKPGSTYTSTSATGEIKNIVIPNGAAMQKAFPSQNVPIQSDRVYSPFIDASMAVGSQNYDALKKYKALTFAFCQVQTMSGITEMAWGGDSPINDLGHVQGSSGAENSNGGKMLDFMRQLREGGTDVSVSLGGQSGTAVWKMYDPVLLAKTLEEFVIGTGITRMDYDIEGQDLQDTRAMQTLSLATAILQQKMKAEGKNIEISLTLASEWDGFRDAQKIMAQFIQMGVEIKYVNGMTMMMAPAHTSGKTVAAQQGQAIDAIAGQIKSAFTTIGVDISDEMAYKLVGATPDIGTDTWADEKMTQTDIEPLMEMLKRKKVGLFAYWNVQGTESSISGLGGYQQSFSDPNTMWRTMSKMQNDPIWGAYDPSYHGVSALTNAETRSQIIASLQSFYNPAPATSGVGTSTAVSALTPDEVRNAANLSGGQLIQWINKDDKLLHTYLTKWWAGPGTNPDNGGDGQFVDQGVVVSQDVTNYLTQAQDLYKQAAIPLWMSGNGSTSAVSTAAISGQGQKVDILPYVPTQVYPNKNTLIIYQGNLYSNKWYGDKSPNGTSLDIAQANGTGTWLLAQIHGANGAPVAASSSHSAPSSMPVVNQPQPTQTIPTTPSSTTVGASTSLTADEQRKLDAIPEYSTFANNGMEPNTVFKYNGEFYKALIKLQKDDLLYKAPIANFDSWALTIYYSKLTPQEALLVPSSGGGSGNSVVASAPVNTSGKPELTKSISVQPGEQVWYQGHVYSWRGDGVKPWQPTDWTIPGWEPGGAGNLWTLIS